MELSEILAPAKLNLDLQIGGKQPDGFHDIKSVILALNFGDIIKIEILPPRQAKPDIEINMNWHVFPAEDIPLEKNLVFRAISLFKSFIGYNFSVFVEIDKYIPTGGGLGGGSSDAASMLKTLNCLVHEGKMLCTNEELMEMGASLGSDIPFFLSNTTAALVSGRGEKVQILNLPPSVYGLSFVLVNPENPCNTASVYNLLDIWRKETNFCQNFQFFETEQLQKIFSSPPSNWPFYNDFLPVFQTENYIKIFDSLKILGAEFSGLSGSGSVCFGVFSDYQKALKAKTMLEKRWPFTILTFPYLRALY